MPDIEFVEPDFEPADDEELDTGPRHAATAGRYRTTRAVRVGAAAVLAVVAGSIVIAVVQHGSTSEPVAGSTFTADSVLAPEAPPGAFRVDHLGNTAAPEGAHPGTLVLTVPASAAAVPGCPAQDSCTATTQLPVAVVFALTVGFPAAQQIRLSTVTAHGDVPGSTLLSRTLTARSGKVRITVDIHPVDDSSTTRAGHSDSGTRHVVYADVVSARLAVSAVATGPRSALPSVSVMRALAADRRLLTGTD